MTLVVSSHVLGMMRGHIDDGVLEGLVTTCLLKVARTFWVVRSINSVIWRYVGEEYVVQRRRIALGILERRSNYSSRYRPSSFTVQVITHLSSS
jgi:hypothetical protein